MRNPPALRFARLVAVALLSATALRFACASDHADPMSLNVLELQDEPNANITDLHAFVVDHEGKVISEASRLGEGERLVISLCVRRSLQPKQAASLNFDGFKFRVHLDLDPKVRLLPEAEEYNKQLEERNKAISAKTAVLEEAKKKGDPAQTAAAQHELDEAIGNRGAFINAHQADLSMQNLYGGILPEPDGIADDAVLEFELRLVKDGPNSQVSLTSTRITGLPGKVNIVPPGKEAEIQSSSPDTINIQADVFDDPFIFPRFFRRNVVGIVTSLPLTSLPQQATRGPMLLWATTHQKDQIDHVGRSLRTQLPRFGYLNTKHPRDHVKEITRVHHLPTVMEDFLATFLAPLEAHRHYDSAPDVMIYDLRRPAKFPNGRALTDDVAETLATAGETLLVELSYAESKQFPRATVNDKQFRPTFPYLAQRWTDAEIKAHAAPGTTFGSFEVPRAPESAAIAAPNLRISTWRTLWRLEMLAIVALVILLLLVVRSWRSRWLLVAVAVFASYFLYYVYADNLMPGTPAAMQQPAKKLLRLIGGAGVIAGLALAWFYALGRRSCVRWPAVPPVFPEGKQGITSADSKPSSFQEIHEALFDPASNRQYYRAWGAPGEVPLPIYKQTLASIARGLFRLWGEFAMLKAARRTLKSRADLRWGSDGKGFRRLVHPMGICLVGEWKIDNEWSETAYTGYFAPGKVGRVLARYSLGGNDPRNGRNRSLGLVGKIFPIHDYPDGDTPRANFITQEDLGGAFTNSIIDVDLTNSPPVTLLKRGSGVFAFLVVILALIRADQEPSERQLYEVAELEKPPNVPASCPRFMRLKVIDAPPVELNELDFRDEILGLMYNPADTIPRRDLIFKIEVSDKGRRTRFQRVVEQEWRQIGTLTFKEAVASYNGDFVVHFHHPVWRKDRNDPTSVARRDLRS